MVEVHIPNGIGKHLDEFCDATGRARNDVVTVALMTYFDIVTLAEPGL
jgi:hypothetical protein